MAKLIPCGHCGSTKLKLLTVECDGVTQHYMVCLTCRACGPDAETEEKAIALWNTRVTVEYVEEKACVEQMP